MRNTTSMPRDSLGGSVVYIRVLRDARGLKCILWPALFSSRRRFAGSTGHRVHESEAASAREELRDLQSQPLNHSQTTS